MCEYAGGPGFTLTLASRELILTAGGPKTVAKLWGSPKAGGPGPVLGRPGPQSGALGQMVLTGRSLPAWELGLVPRARGPGPGPPLFLRTTNNSQGNCPQRRPARGTLTTPCRGGCFIPLSPVRKCRLRPTLGHLGFTAQGLHWPMAPVNRTNGHRAVFSVNLG